MPVADRLQQRELARPLAPFRGQREKERRRAHQQQPEEADHEQRRDPARAERVGAGVVEQQLRVQHDAGEVDIVEQLPDDGAHGVASGGGPDFGHGQHRAAGRHQRGGAQRREIGDHEPALRRIERWEIVHDRANPHRDRRAAHDDRRDVAQREPGFLQRFAINRRADGQVGRFAHDQQLVVRAKPRPGVAQRRRALPRAAAVEFDPIAARHADRRAPRRIALERLDRRLAVRRLRPQVVQPDRAGRRANDARRRAQDDRREPQRPLQRAADARLQRGAQLAPLAAQVVTRAAAALFRSELALRHAPVAIQHAGEQLEVGIVRFGARPDAQRRRILGERLAGAARLARDRRQQLGGRHAQLVVVELHQVVETLGLHAQQDHPAARLVAADVADSAVSRRRRLDAGARVERLGHPRRARVGQIRADRDAAQLRADRVANALLFRVADRRRVGRRDQPHRGDEGDQRDHRHRGGRPPRGGLQREQAPGRRAGAPQRAGELVQQTRGDPNQHQRRAQQQQPRTEHQHGIYPAALERRQRPARRLRAKLQEQHGGEDQQRHIEPGALD